MESISMIGFLLFFSTLIYLVYHLIRKLFNRERTLSKKKFYPILIGSFLLFVIGLIFTDTTLRDELNEALATNETLTTEHKVVLDEHQKIELTNEKLNNDIEKATKEIEALELKLPELEEKEQQLNTLESVHKEELTALEKDLSTLEESHSDLKNKVNNLK